MIVSNTQLPLAKGEYCYTPKPFLKFSWIATRLFFLFLLFSSQGLMAHNAAVSKSAPATATAGETYDYTIGFSCPSTTNLAPCTPVIITDVLPPGIDFLIGAAGVTFDEPSNTVSFDFGSVSNGSTASGTIINASFVSNTVRTTAKSADLIACTADYIGGVNTVGGNVFNDIDNDGADAGAMEAGQENVLVQVYDCDGGLLCEVFTDGDGNWSCDNAVDGEEYRVEFSTPNQPYLQPSVAGIDNGTDVQFVTSPNCEVGYGVLDPSNYCEDVDPFLITSCYLFGDASSAFSDPGNGSVVQFNRSNAGPVGGSNVNNNVYLATIAQTGALGGLSVHQSSGLLYFGALAKRGVDYGPGADGMLGTSDDPGAIYIVDQSNPNLTGNLATLNVPNAGPAIPTPRGIDGTQFGPGGIYENMTCADIATNPRPASIPTGWFSDACAYDIAGKEGLGDFAIDESTNTLYVVNLYDRHLYSFDVSSGDAATIQATIQDVGPLFNDGTTNDWPDCTDGEWRPNALEWDNGALYVGGVCSGEYNDPTTEPIAAANADMSVSVFRFTDPSSGTGATSVLSGPLDYLRAEGSSTGNALWQPWTASLTDFFAYGQSDIPRVGSPILTDIEFTDDGTMLLAFRDRTSEQNFNGSTGVYVDENGAYDAAQVYRNGDPAIIRSAGDLRRACQNGTTWEIEGSATCGPVGSSTVLAEYFAGDNVTDDFHRELTQGYIALRPGATEVAVIAMDPTDALNAGGVRFLPLTGGTDQGEGYQIFASGDGGAAFPFAAKGTGLGDIDYFCAPPAIEIGNYVWQDTNMDGDQDACEEPVAGLFVTLIDQTTGLVVDVDTTDANGNYYFTEDEGLTRDSSYIVVFGYNPADVDQQYDPITGNVTIDGMVYSFTDPDSGEGTNPDQNDSDAITMTVAGVGDFPSTTINDISQTNHDLDAGLLPVCPTVMLNDVAPTVCGSTTLLLVNLVDTVGTADFTFQWSTSGTGTFDGVDGDLNPQTGDYLTAITYTPGAADFTAGSVVLTLQTVSSFDASCPEPIDSVTVTILNVDCGNFFWDGSND